MEPLDQHIADVLNDEHSGVQTRRPDGPARILVVDGDPSLRLSIVGALEDQRHRCTCVGRLDEARHAIAKSRFDVIVLNRSMPDGEGLEIAPLLQKTSPSTKIIM